MSFELSKEKPTSNIEIIPSQPGYVTVRNHNLGLERTYRKTVDGEILCVGRSGNNAGITKNILTLMDGLAATYFAKEVVKKAA